jgi:plasmid stabilization system protein ParE
VYSIVWTKRAQKQMLVAHDYISSYSPQNAQKVLLAIIKHVEKAIANPEIFAADKFKLNNDGTYRAFEKYRYRISYRFTNSTIRVLRVRHTKMKPKAY